MFVVFIIVIFCDLVIGQQIVSYFFVIDVELEIIFDCGQVGFVVWSVKSFEQCVDVLCVMVVVLWCDCEKLVVLVIVEMGKVQVEVLVEIEKCVVLCDWYVDYGVQFLCDELIQVFDDKVYVFYLLLGVVLGIMLWNFLYWQVMCVVVLILMGGNGFLLKLVENIVGIVQLFDVVWCDVGLLEGIFIVVNISCEGISCVIVDDCIVVVILIGSVVVGCSIVVQVGQVLKKVVLELGGLDLFIVLVDVDLDVVVDVVVVLCFQNIGQVCIVGKCIIVEDVVYDCFVVQFCQKVQVLIIGDGCDLVNCIGLMVCQDLLEQLDVQVCVLVDVGVQLFVGGYQFDCLGVFYVFIVLVDVELGMQVFDMEMFGLVVLISCVCDVDYVVELVNQSEFGFSGNFWIGDCV